MKKAVCVLWESRSRHYGRALEGVMSKSFPRPINEFFDEWMYEQVKETISSRKMAVLDVGCGYGRLSKKLLDGFPDLTTVGVDIAKGYVDMYNEDLGPRGKAVVANVSNLPFKDNVFDRVIVVTTLMYITGSKEQERTMKEIFRVLKQGGKVVIIERSPIGYSWITFSGLMRFLRGKKHSEIKAVSYSKTQMISLINLGGGVIKKVSGTPLLTLFFPLLFAFSFINKKGAKKIIARLASFEKLFTPLLTASLYISYTAFKK